MTRKRLIIIVCVLIFVGAYMSFIKWIDEPMYPELPTKSSSGKIILTSRGCCFWVEDVTVSLLDESGNKTVVISEDSVYEYDIYEYKNISKVETPIQVIIDFVGHYPDKKDVSLIVGEFLNTDELFAQGLLLHFGDGDLIVRNGNKEKFFRDGAFRGDDDGPWYQEK